MAAALYCSPLSPSCTLQDGFAFVFNFVFVFLTSQIQVLYEAVFSSLMHGLSTDQQIHEAGIVGDGEGAAQLSEICGLVSKTSFPHRKPAQTGQSIHSKCAAERDEGKESGQ